MVRKYPNWLLLMVLACSSCAHEFDEFRRTDWYRSREGSVLQAKAEYDKLRKQAAIFTVGFHHQAIWVGKVATISTNELENTGVAKPIVMSPVRQLVGSIPLRASDVAVHFSSPKDFPEGLPKIGESWAFRVGANSKMIWYVWSGSRMDYAKGN